MILLVIAGILSWSLAEYWIHRGLGHKPRNNPFTKEHLQHHFKRDYFAPVTEKAKAAFAIIPVLTLLAYILIDLESAFIYAVSFTMTYLYYEYTHWSLHKNAPKSKFGMDLRKHHLYHHFVNKEKNHGVTSSFWDRIFGTYVAVDEVVPVPKKYYLDWLVTEEMEIKDTYQSMFTLA